MKFIALIATTAVSLFAAGAEACSGSYTIRSGDTFDNIAARGRISSNVLQLCNPGQSPTTLQIGQVISYPYCRRSKTYTVVPGDTLWKIGTVFGVGLDGMLDCNPTLRDPNFITPGQRLQVPY